MAQAGTLLPPLQVLQEQLTGHGIPWASVGGPPPGEVAPWWVTYKPEATPAQIAEGDAIAAAFDGLPRRYRNMFAVYADVAALTLGQKGKVWQNLGVGGDKLYYHDMGPNVAAIMVLDLLVWSAGLTQAASDEAKLRLIAQYVQDNAYYLDGPTWDPTIAVLGVEGVT
jgi:hypothetical protein